MTGFLDQLEHELLRVAATPKPDLASAHNRWQRVVGWWTNASRPRRLTAVAVIATMIATPAVAATVIWRPSLETPGEGALTISDTAPPAQELAALGVLRRAATATDENAVTISQLKWLNDGLSGVRTNYIRVLSDTPGQPRLLLLPAQRYTGPPNATVERIDDPLCVSGTTPRSDGGIVGGGGTCLSLNDITSGHAIGSYGLWEYVLVPDGVATVRATYPDGETHTLTATNNIAIDPSPPIAPIGPVIIPPGQSASVTPPTPPRAAAFPTRMTWLDATGTQIANILNP